MHQKMLQGINFGPSSAWYTIVILLLKKILTCNILWCIVYIDNQFPSGELII